MNALDLKGRNAVVTGGAAGIGLAIAQRLAQDGARIVVNGIVSDDEGAAVCADIAARHGVEARYVRADLR